MKPLITSPLTIAALFRAAESILEGIPAWHSVGSGERAARQDAAVQTYANYRTVVSDMREIETMCAWSHTDINAWLAAHGFDIKLDPFSPNTFGMAATSNFLVQWLERASLQTIARRQTRDEYAAFRLKSDWLLCDSYPDASTTFWARTQSNDVLGFAMAPRPGSDGELLAEVLKRMDTSRHARNPCPAHVDLPMVDLNARLDMSYLVDMWTRTPNRKSLDIVTQAVGQAMFRMNETGARAHVAMAASVARSFSAPLVVPFDQPFYLWIERPGVNVPLFAAYLEPDCWKKPAEL